MFEQILIDQNPHWHEPIRFVGIRRDKFKKLLDYVPLPHVIAVTGVRRCGKSTLLKQLIDYLLNHESVPPENVLFLNLEQPFLLQYADDVANLENIYQEYLTLKLPRGRKFILLDEMQFFANWPVFVKAHYESQECKFIITGSNSTLLSHEMVTLLSGRSLALELYPLSFGEVAVYNKINIESKEMIVKGRHKLSNLLMGYIESGGFPEVYSLGDNKLKSDILNAYAKTILYQDIAPRLGVRKPDQLEKLFIFLITNIGSNFSYHNLAANFSLSDKVIKEYIQSFSDAYLLFELDKFSYSLKTQLRSPKKVYAIDTGMANACGFRFVDNYGKLLENNIFMELKRRNLEIFYYKTVNNYEIDFVVKQDKVISLIQVAHDISHSNTLVRETRALSEALDELKLSRGNLIYTHRGAHAKITDDRITAIPAYEWLAQ